MKKLITYIQIVASLFFISTSIAENKKSLNTPTSETLGVGAKKNPTEFSNEEVSLNAPNASDEKATELAELERTKAQKESSPPVFSGIRKCIADYIAPGNLWPWIWIGIGLLLVLIDYLFPVDWPAFIGYFLFALGIFGICGFQSIPSRVSLAVVTLIGLLVLHIIFLSQFLTNADD